MPRDGRRVDPNVGLSAGPFGLLATESPLAVAAAHGHTDAVLALLEAGGTQPDLGWSVGRAIGATSSPLAFSVDREHDTVIRALLKRGATPDLGRTVGPGKHPLTLRPGVSVLAALREPTCVALLGHLGPQVDCSISPRRCTMRLEMICPALWLHCWRCWTWTPRRTARSAVGRQPIPGCDRDRWWAIVVCDLRQLLSALSSPSTVEVLHRQTGTDSKS